MSNLPPNALCKGAWILKTACGQCKRCIETAGPTIERLMGELDDTIATAKIYEGVHNKLREQLENAREDYAALVRGAGESLVRFLDQLRAKDQECEALRADKETLLAALRPLVEACDKDCAGPSMDDFPDEDSVGRGPNGEMALTFGMIRNGRAAINKVTGATV